MKTEFNLNQAFSSYKINSKIKNCIWLRTFKLFPPQNCQKVWYQKMNILSLWQLTKLQQNLHLYQRLTKFHSLVYKKIWLKNSGYLCWTKKRRSGKKSKGDKRGAEKSEKMQRKPVAEQSYKLSTQKIKRRSEETKEEEKRRRRRRSRRVNVCSQAPSHSSSFDCCFPRGWSSLVSSAWLLTPLGLAFSRPCGRSSAHSGI